MTAFPALPWQRVLLLGGLLGVALGLGQLRAAPAAPPTAPLGWAGITRVGDIGPYGTGGRVRAIAVHPALPGLVYLGGVSGGVWKFLNYGESWWVVGDALPNMAVTTIALHPFDPYKLFVGTGEGFVSGTVALTGQRRAVVILEYAQAGQKASLQLYWASRRQPFALIPSPRFYPPVYTYINNVFGQSLWLDSYP